MNRFSPGETGLSVMMLPLVAHTTEGSSATSVLGVRSSVTLAWLLRHNRLVWTRQLPRPTYYRLLDGMWLQLFLLRLP